MKPRNSQKHPREGQKKPKNNLNGQDKKTNKPKGIPTAKMQMNNQSNYKHHHHPLHHQHVLMESRNILCMYVLKGRALKLTCNLRYRISWLLENNFMYSNCALCDIYILSRLHVYIFWITFKDRLEVLD